MRKEGTAVRSRCRALYAAVMILLMICADTGCAEECVWPEASGTRVYRDGGFQIDSSNSTLGYVMIRGPKSEKELKLRIKKDDTTLTYDLNMEGQYEVFPLQLGSGRYRIQLFRNSGQNRYTEIGDYSVNTELYREDAAFLVPNQYVDYTPETKAVLMSWDMCANAATDREKFDLIRDFIRNNFVYDYMQAVNLSVRSGTLPDIDWCFTYRRGICQDLSAVAACMLRVENIPAKVVIGYANNSYHAWVELTADGVELRYDPTADIVKQYRDVVYCPERWY